MYRFFASPAGTPTASFLLTLPTRWCKRYTGDPPHLPSAGNTARPKGILVNKEEGISKDAGGFGHYAGSITTFMKPEAEKKRPFNENDPLPCSVAGSQASSQAMQAALMEEAAMTGVLPSPRRAAANAPKGGETPHGFAQTSSKASSLPRRIVREVKRPPKIISKGLDETSTTKPLNGSSTTKGLDETSTTKGLDKNFTTKPLNETSTTKPLDESSAQSEKERETAAYYRDLPHDTPSREELWRRVKQASAARASDPRGGPDPPFVLHAEEVDYLRMEEDLKVLDPLHHTIGEMAYLDEKTRRNYYAMWYLALSLNKARWSALEVQSQRGVKSTGAGVKLMFWKDAVQSILERRGMLSGQFTDSHPILRPFGATVASTPGLTKTFIRGFTDARLRVFLQPGNVKQLFDHFDKFYGYFFYSLLEFTTGKDENAEHLLLHVGRAIGLVQHCVMFWKKYIRLGTTMLPADLCADNHVNLALLKNLPLASRDGGVRKLLYDVLCIARTEMLHAQTLAPSLSPKAWPILMEAWYPNYYLSFLQRRNYNVSAMFADYNIENPGLSWFRVKKRCEWDRYQSVERMLSEAAPLPWLNFSLFHSPSRYKMSEKEKK
ncbi:unnamed protein product [Phytomonas sp. Hart1]|nr:unnamed protein product [Phytomonas sp. Hart1]|eukprot:CCW69269.1 unnamed protein product [Phytomonas sp. isolate Hart1]